MGDLRDRFATLDRVPVPDIWSDVERRLEALGTSAPTGHLVAVKPGWRGRISDESSGPAQLPGRRHHVGLPATAALIAALLIGGAIALGAGLIRLPSLVPPATPESSLRASTPLPSVESSPRPTDQPALVPAAWKATGAMTQVRGGASAIRVGESATLLPDDTVLVAGGGLDADAASHSSERYDPTTGEWTAAGPMVTNRTEQTATILRDGRVLIAGGSGDDGNDLASAELFDPETGRWTATGSMSDIRSGHTATLLQDGRVLVTGGLSTDRTYQFPHLASAELYDPTSGLWTATGDMTQARWGHTATLLPDGKVLVAGGAVFLPDDSEVFGSAELYDPDSGRWTATGSLAEARVGHIAILLGNGKVLVLGGFVNGSGGGSPSPELFDPSTGQWAATANMKTIRSAFTATLLLDGRLLVAGGMSGPLDGAQIPLASAELFDPRNGSWTATATMASPRSGHFAVRLADGTVLVSGGSARDPNRGGAFIAVLESEVYHPGIGN
jgi:N-acetylneuraminic acid mutarotase